MGVGFRTVDGKVYCDDFAVDEVREKVKESPFYLYSFDKLKENFEAYKSALNGQDSIIGYAVKANSNFHILRYLARLGAGAVVVSANEYRIARKAGFPAGSIVLNGNGKCAESIELAAMEGAILNIDSDFDVDRINALAEAIVNKDRAEQKEGRKVIRLLVRVNPDLDPNVHPHISTGPAKSKFGVPAHQLLSTAAKLNRGIFDIVGVHCHLGSTIRDTKVMHDAAELLITHLEELAEQGFDATIMNIGGGLGIDYEQREDTRIPTAAAMLEPILESIRRRRPSTKLIVEPGRSVVGNCGALITTVVGTKKGKKNFIVIDGSMAAMIRPALYDAYHHIEFTQKQEGPEETWDVVGPVCESADFLGKERVLPTPSSSSSSVGLIVHDAGAYGFVMGSNYNLHMRPPEYAVARDSNGEKRLVCIRKAEKLEDFLAAFPDIDEGDLPL
eukprot:CAMPEP_0113886706 /NCGR_PEP_ID=MMETSP0780_2-20120614/11724_1 /TAXON_ID=652834 /ORGANISM="Palpitomonas bilix" /LENGTH=444 /DNA_ID=CAMNT_0000874991 /DNA_START=55 /DNA_END=1389 /DNA_ORIENTATION=+ /assembly_acc=CAM_ASM_000599